MCAVEALSIRYKMYSALPLQGQPARQKGYQAHFELQALARRLDWHKE